MFPTNRADIEAELLKQPGHRGFAPVRNWRPGWTIEYLEERTARANGLIAAGVNFVRALSIGTPRLWSVGEILTASNMNTYISDILDDLKGTNGPIEYTDAIVIDSLTTTARNALTATNGMVIYNSTLNVFQRYENGAWVNHTDATSLTLSGGAQGDALFLNPSGTVTRLAAGTDRQALQTRGSNADPTFADLEDIRVAGTTARGDVFYVGSNGRLNRLAAGTSNFFFQTKGSTADPVWASASATVVFVRLTTGTSWTVPTGVNAVYVEVIGGGSGGGAGGGYPGEGGLTARHFFLASSLGTSVTYAIGAGGAAASAGGNTVFAGHAVGLGGRGLVIANSLNDRPEATGQIGANGGGGGGAGTNSLDGLGSGGGGFAYQQSGSNGGAGGAGGIPGGGGGVGGPSSSAGAGGAGARGEIRIWYW